MNGEDWSLPKNYGIGVVLGLSGEGKTTILNQLRPGWDKTRFGDSRQDMAIVSILEGTAGLQAVGLNKIPTWVRPAAFLSNGERSRFKIAASLGSGLVIDDFATVVDDATAW